MPASEKYEQREDENQEAGSVEGGNVRTKETGGGERHK